MRQESPDYSRGYVSEAICECPSCGDPLQISTIQEDMPYFGRVLQSSFSCPKCGWKFTDIFPFEEKKGAQYRMSFGSQDFCVRVVKSSYCTMEIPELGILVEPGPASQGYVTNIEGVLLRMKEAVKMGIKWGDEEQKRNGRLILKRMTDLGKGKESVTLVLRDPLGYSAIISEKAERASLQT